MNKRHEHQAASPPWQASAEEQKRWDALQTKIGYRFGNQTLLLTALTHPSFTQGMDEGATDNQRMEFLGDAVLELCASRFLYDKYPAKDEGWMTKTRSLLVREESLFAVAQEIQLGYCLRLSPSEQRNGGRQKPSILSDAVEALICAIYLDGGWQAASAFILRFITPEGRDVEAELIIRDPKTKLQEWLQQEGSVKISYEIIDESGAAHERSFTAQVTFNGRALGQGQGRSKKEAEQQAALQALEYLQQNTKSS